MIDKIVECIQHCKELHETSCGEILPHITSEEFERMITMVTMLKEVINSNKGLR